jgi:cyclohexa-1,5-dienecarbonyl-CoA hydratase
VTAARPETGGGVRLEAASHGERTATLWLDRPPLNVLDLATLAALEDAVAALAEPSGGAPPQVLLVRGAGQRAFSAGVAVEDHTGDRIGPMLERFHGALRRLRDLPSITVAVVHGHCLGGGMELAAACDLVVATEGARFGQPEIKLGCYPPWAAALYPALLGTRRTFDLLLTGRTLTAAEMATAGFVSRLAADGELETATAALVAELTSHSAAVTALTKRAIRAGEGGAFEAALAECERLYLQELTASRDMAEGVEAFLAKRAPRWSHG